MLGSFKTWKFGKYEAYTTFQSKPSSQKEIFITLTWFRIILLYNFPGNFSWMIYCPNISISPLLKMSISNGFEKWLLKLKFLTFAKLHILSSNSFIIISINALKKPTLAGRTKLRKGDITKLNMQLMFNVCIFLIWIHCWRLCLHGWITANMQQPLLQNFLKIYFSTF